MFTGIVESTGIVTGVAPTAAGRRLRVDLGNVAAQCKVGDSICISGVCLTVAAIRHPVVEFDVIFETLERSTLETKSPGDRVNFERSLRAGDRLDGHFVQGHVDGTATVEQVRRTGGEHVVWFRPQDELTPYVVPKGSIAIDGVSLTIAEARPDVFSVAIIPTTLERTTFGQLQEADVVNIETDIIARTVVHHLSTASLVNSLQKVTVP